MIVSVSTDSVERNDRIALWADLVCAHLVQVDCRKVADRQSFNGAISKLPLPGCEIAQVLAGGQTVNRTPYQIGRANDEYFLVNIQRSGERILRQGGREVLLKPGDSALYSSTRPYELEFGDKFHQTVLIFPAAALRKIDRQIDRFCGIALPAGSGGSRLLLKLVDALYEIDDDVPRESVASLVTALTETFVGTMAGSGIVRHGLSGYHLARIKEFTLGNLGDPELSVAKISEKLGLSVSHVHRIFTPESQSVMEWVWSRRLENCRRDLVEISKAGLTISEIAYRWGFNDSSHFSKAFRQRFGLTPSEWRRMHSK